MERPFFKFGSAELEEKYRQSADVEVWQEVLDEIRLRESKRDKPKRKQLELCEEIERAILEARNPSGEATQPELKFKAQKKRSPGNERRREKPDQPRTASRSQKRDEHIDAGASGGATGASDPDAASDDAEERNTVRRDRLGSIRPVGNLPDTPEKWVIPPSTKLAPSWKADDPVINRHEAALRALIFELKRKSVGAIQVVVQNGRKTNLEGEGSSYQFPWAGDEDLFEGASVTAIADGVRTTGRLVSLSAQSLIVSLQADVGAEITACTLIIDNTAMLEALADRLKAISDGEDTAFNLKLAEAAIENNSSLVEIEMTGEVLAGLNQRQSEAVRKAASASVFFLWGPPGTGKTKTLSSINQVLYRADKRVLICSNTNQAVDQVLATLCAGLAKSAGGPERAEALVDGHFVRVGRIADDGPLSPWNEWVTIDGIVARKSVELIEMRSKLESDEKRVTHESQRARNIVGLFEQLDRADHSYKAAVSRNQACARDLQVRKDQRANSIEKQIALQKELNLSDTGGLVARLLRRRPEEIRIDLEKVTAEIAEADLLLDFAGRELQAASQALQQSEEAFRAAKQRVSGLDKEKASAEVKVADEKLSEIRREIAEINGKLENVAKTVVNDARVVGATATKLFLSPKTFTNFDAVIVDEASMLVLPALFHAAGLAKERVVISGDPRQLPPIVQSNEAVILNEIGEDVFSASHVDEAEDGANITQLEEQFRMNAEICDLISGPIYKGKLRTAKARETGPRAQSEMFSATVTLVDTSAIGPFVAKDPAGSKFNLMNAVLIRNICQHLSEGGLDSKKDIGVIAPYAAQKKLIQRILKDNGMPEITAGTVHRYQGDEKKLILLDLTDGLGLRGVGPWFQADHYNDVGAKLFNVAISRAMEHLVFIGDLAWLDKKLPGRSLLRGWLHSAQQQGQVIDARKVLALTPISDEFEKYGVPVSLSREAVETGLFNESDFDAAVHADIGRAQKGVAIWSAFVTPDRAAKFAGMFGALSQKGVRIRCVLRPPWNNGSMDREIGEEAFRILEGAGCTVDTRLNMHEKAVIIDDRIVWFGSLNPLSHTGKTGEMMARIEGGEVSRQIAAFLSINATSRAEQREGLAYEAENPPCGCGKTKAVYARSKYGKFWRCLDGECDWKGNDRQANRSEGKMPDLGPAPDCPKCGGEMIARNSARGAFFGCKRYPACDGKSSAPSKAFAGKKRRAANGVSKRGAGRRR